MRACAVMLLQSQMKQGQNLSFLMTGQRIPAIKHKRCQTNEGGFEPPKPPPWQRPCHEQQQKFFFVLHRYFQGKHICRREDLFFDLHRFLLENIETA